jgi:DNA-binding NtrC family response regulator
MIRLQQQTILLVSDDAELCAAARHEFEVRAEGLRVTSVGTVDAARKVVEGAAPSVILLEETSLAGDGREAGEPPALNSIVAALAVYAPAVVIGQERRETELAALVATGAADFVPRSRISLPVALGLVERRLRQRAENRRRRSGVTRRRHRGTRALRRSPASRAEQSVDGNPGKR